MISLLMRLNVSSDTMVSRLSLYVWFSSLGVVYFLLIFLLIYVVLFLIVMFIGLQVCLRNL
jgi:hypothetical protein